MIIGDLTTEILGGIIDLGKGKVSWMKGNNTVELPLILDYMRHKTITEGKYSADFTFAT